MEYTGYEVYKPEVSITCGDYALKVNEDYRISYDNNYSVGTATVTLTGMELFRGTETRNFESKNKKVKKPGRVKIRYVYVQKKKLVVSWKWKSNVAGFQLQYAQNKKFTKKKKTKSFGEYKSSATIKGLKKGKKYYVRVRAYRKKSGKKAKKENAE